MQILLADDDAGYRLLVKTALVQWGYQPIVAADGTMAWNLLHSPEAPPIAILDWMMPGYSGLELCRKLRQQTKSIYLILLTANREKADIIEGLQTGADDYITKPFDRQELFARLQTGVRIVQLQQNLEKRVTDLENALAQVNHLSGLLPICCYCKNIRDDQNYWQRVEDYVSANTEVRFSHGICPNCYKAVVEPQLAQTGSAPVPS
jgi:sigma-B regulation protein RsbU (phosphoserine phosphatase)